jgi:hypothetical protein
MFFAEKMIDDISNNVCVSMLSKSCACCFILLFHFLFYQKKVSATFLREQKMKFLKHILLIEE